MTDHIILLRKVRSTRATWMYIAGEDRGTLTVKDEDILYQMAGLVEMFSNLYDGNLAVVSPQLVRHVQTDMAALFPEVALVPLSPDLIRLFDRAFVQNVQTRRLNPNTLYVCSDASGGHMDVPAAWAWCSGGAEGNYAVGFSGFVNTNVAELEGLMNAIVAHSDHPASRVHVYSDSANAVDDVTLLSYGQMPRSAREFKLTGLAERVMDVMDSRNVTFEWVRGHRQHRLNSMADNMSRLARHRFTQGQTISQFAGETDALFSMM